MVTVYGYAALEHLLSDLRDGTVVTITTTNGLSYPSVLYFKLLYNSNLN